MPIDPNDLKEPFKLLLQFCHTTVEEIREQFLNKAVLDCTLTRLGCTHISEGSAALDTIRNSRRDPHALENAFEQARDLKRRWREDYNLNLGAFLKDGKVRKKIEEKLQEAIKFLNHSMHVLEQGPEEKHDLVTRAWQNASRYAGLMWASYAELQIGIDRDKRVSEELKGSLPALETVVINDLSWNYDERHLQSLGSIAWNLRAIRMGATRYQLSPDQTETKQKAKEEIRKSIQEMSTLSKQIEGEREAKTKGSNDRMRKKKRNATHVRYEIQVTIAGEKIRENIRVLNGQQPKFCAARHDPVQPMHTTGFSDRAHPTLEARLDTTENSQTIILKELRFSSEDIRGSFSQRDIKIQLPKNRTRTGKNEYTGTFGESRSKQKLTVTCTRKGEETCTEYPCKEANKTHWINSGGHRHESVSSSRLG